MNQDIFSFLPIEVIQDHRLGLIETRVLTALYSFRNKNTDIVWPHREKIAQRCGYKPEVISRAITKLVNKGWLARQQHRGPNTYRVNVPSCLQEETVTESVTVTDQDVNSDRLGTETVTDPVTPKLTRTNQEHKEKINKKRKVPISRKIFIPPEAYRVKAYATQLEYKDFDGQAFVDYYESVGWMVGKKKMVDWKSAVRGWYRRSKDYQKEKTSHAKQKRAYTAIAADDIAAEFQRILGRPPPAGKSTQECMDILKQEARRGDGQEKWWL